MQITASDQELIEAATQIIKDRYEFGRHHVGAALRTESGRIVTGVDVGTYLGRAGVCAEAIALGRMLSETNEKFVSIAAVYHPHPDSDVKEPYVCSPCGVCREMLYDYNPDAIVVYAEGYELKKSMARDLLPAKWVKR